MVNVAVQIGFVEYCLIWADYSSTCISFDRNHYKMSRSIVPELYLLGVFHWRQMR